MSSELFKKLLMVLKRDFKPSLFIGSTKDYPILQSKAHNTFFGTLFYSLYSMVQFVYHEPCIRSDTFFYNEIEKNRMSKMMVCIGITKKKQRLAYHLTQVLSRHYPEFRFFWMNQFIEITPKGWLPQAPDSMPRGKEKGLRKAATPKNHLHYRV